MNQYKNRQVLTQKGNELRSRQLNQLTPSLEYEMKQLLITIAAVLIVGSVLADPIHDAAKNGNLDLVQAELEKGVDVNLKDAKSMQETPLHFAAEGGQTEVAKLLIAKGANVNAISRFGHMRIPTTPLDKANGEPWDSAEIKAKKKEIFDLLREQGGKGWQELFDLMPRLNFIRSPFGFTFNTVEGKTYIVESGISADKWNKLREIKGTGSEVKFIDMRRIYFQKHFYRVVIED